MIGIEIQCTMQFTLLSLTIFFEQRFTATLACIMVDVAIY